VGWRAIRLQSKAETVERMTVDNQFAMSGSHFLIELCVPDSDEAERRTSACFS
jgi:hypothetical protein